MNITKVPLTHEVTEHIQSVQSRASYVLTVNTVILLYEFLLNLDNEIKYIWGKKFDAMSLRYALARYGSLVTFISATVINFLEVYASTKPSFGATIFPQAASLLPYCGVQGHLFVRFYDLPGNSKRLLFVMSLILLSDFALNVTRVSRKFRQANQSDVQTHEQAIFIFQGVFLAVFNTLVFLLSTHRIVRIWRLERTLGTSHDITREFLSTQGLMRFGYVVLTTVTVIATLTHPFESIFSTPSIPFQNSLLIIIPCRVMLGLQQVKAVDSLTHITFPSHKFKNRDVNRPIKFVADSEVKMMWQ